MPVTISGTSGLAGVNGSASTPAVQGEDTNTGVFFPAADTIAFAEGGVEVARFNSGGNLLVGTTSAPSGGSVSTVFARGATTNLQIHSTDGGGAMYGGLTGGGAIVYTYTGAVGSETYSERARIDSSGNLLVGTTTLSQPSGVRDVLVSREAANEGARFVAKGGPSGFTSYAVLNSGSHDNITTHYSPSLMFTSALRFFSAPIDQEPNDANTTERARIDSNGNLLVGTTTVSTTGNGIKLQPSEGGTGLPTQFWVGNSTSTDAYWGMVRSTSNNTWRFYGDWAGRLYAQSTSIISLSDERLKENIRDLDTGLDTVMALRPRRFDWKDGQGQNKKDAAGFIAQEVESVLPEMVTTGLEEDENGDKYKMLAPGDLIPTLVKAIQELKAEVDSLKAQLEAN